MDSTVFIIISLVIMLVQVILGQKPYYHINDLSSYRDKEKMIQLTHELIVDAKNKIHQTDGIRNTMSTQIGFEVGMIMGQIREKYKSMLELYRQTHNKYTGKSKIIIPAVSYRKPIHYFVRMEFISNLELDIERLVHILETIPEYHFDDPMEHHMKKVKMPKRLNQLRTEDRSEEMELLITRMEEKVKSDHRQRYLMDRLGQPANHSTTEKRFLRKWPVEETWSLDKYN